TGRAVNVPGAGGALAFTPDGTRVVVGAKQWSTVPVDGGPLTPVTGTGFVPDTYAPRLDPFQRDVWFAGSRAYVVGRGGALVGAAPRKRAGAFGRSAPPSAARRPPSRGSQIRPQCPPDSFGPPVWGWERPGARWPAPPIFSSNRIAPIGRSMPKLVP